MSVNPIHLTVVEDNPADARLVMAYLREPPALPVVWRHHGLLGEALESLKSEPCDILLLDLGLPDSQGLEGPKRVREAFPHLPVIILSGAGEDDWMAQAVAAGAQDYLLKSEIAASSLKRSIRHALERAHAELALKASERRYGDIVNNSPDLIFITRGGRIAFVNEAGVRMLRAGSADQILGREALEFFHPDFHPAIRGRVRALLAGPCVLPVANERMLACDGSAVEVEVWAGSYLSNGQLEIQVVCRDISERMGVERSLSKSEKNLARAQQIAKMGSWEREIGSGRLYWSRELRRLFGIETDGELTYESFLELVHPDDRARLDEARETALASSGRLDVEHRIIRPDGAVRWIHELGEVERGADGAPIRLVGTAQDITQRKLAEEKLREQATLLDQAQDAILVLSIDQRILYWNKGAERIYGWSAAEAVGEPALGLLHRDARAFHAAMLEVVARGTWHGELEEVSRDGDVLTVECRSTLIRNEAGEPKSILLTNTDITRRKRLEAQFLRAQRLESIGTLAGGVAHNLNNVLTPIVMSVDLLAASERDPERLELLGLIESSAKRGSEMIRQVLSFARGVDGQHSRVDLRDLIRDLGLILRETFPKDIQTETRVGDGLWAIDGDATQIHQVLLNICVNARDAMPNGGRLSIKAENRDIDSHYAAMNMEARVGPHVKIEIADTGTGIPPEIAQKIFDPFFTTKEPGKGTGLGLSTSTAIIKSHKGFMRVYSEPNQGTSFRIYLPASESATEPPPLESVAEFPRGNGECILVVDDEPAILKASRHTLEAFGYRVLEASDGSEAVTIYAKHLAEVALVITDMMMPVMDGPSTIKVLRRLNPKVRVIGASGIASHGRVALAKADGLKHFLSKPFAAESLLRLVRSVLDQPEPG